MRSNFELNPIFFFFYVPIEITRLVAFSNSALDVQLILQAGNIKWQLDKNQ